MRLEKCETDGWLLNLPLGHFYEVRRGTATAGIVERQAGKVIRVQPDRQINNWGTIWFEGGGSMSASYGEWLEFWKQCPVGEPITDSASI